MARYVRDDRTCSIRLAGTKLTVVEPDGTTRVEIAASESEARAKQAWFVAQWVRDGWTEIDGPDGHDEPPPLVFDARNPELEAALLDDPEHAPTWQVYGDWLQQQNDARGAYIALAAAGLHDKARELAAQHGDYFHLPDVRAWLGSWGFVRAIEVTRVSELEQALAAPAGRFITQIAFARTSSRRLDELIAALGRLAPPTLRQLVITSDGTLATFAPIESLLARLRTLILRCGVAFEAFEHLARAPLPKLEFLSVRGERWQVMLANPDGLGALVRLQVDTLSDVVATSWLAPRLETLMVSHLDIDRFLMHHAAGRLPRLTHLQFPTEDDVALEDVARLTDHVRVGFAR